MPSAFFRPDRVELSTTWTVKAFEEYHALRLEGMDHATAAAIVRDPDGPVGHWPGFTLPGKSRTLASRAAGAIIRKRYPEIFKGTSPLTAAALGRILATLTGTKTVKFSAYDAEVLYDDLAELEAQADTRHPLL